MLLELKPGQLTTNNAKGDLLVKMIDGVSDDYNQARIERIQKAMEVKALAASLRAQGFAQEADTAADLAETAIRIANI